MNKMLKKFNHHGWMVKIKIIMYIYHAPSIFLHEISHILFLKVFSIPYLVKGLIFNDDIENTEDFFKYVILINYPTHEVQLSYISIVGIILTCFSQLIIAICIILLIPSYGWMFVLLNPMGFIPSHEDCVVAKNIVNQIVDQIK